MYMFLAASTSAVFNKPTNQTKTEPLTNIQISSASLLFTAAKIKLSHFEYLVGDKSIHSLYIFSTALPLNVHVYVLPSQYMYRVHRSRS